MTAPNPITQEFSTSENDNSRHVPQSDRDKFLGQFETTQRNAIAQYTHRAAREGASTPAAVIAGVIATIRERMTSPWADALERDRMRGYLEALAAEPVLAQRYAASVLAWLALPAAEREARKTERAREYQRAAMATQAPTERQLAYLAKLGHTGPAPASKADASDLIDAMVREGRPL